MIEIAEKKKIVGFIKTHYKRGNTLVEPKLNQKIEIKWIGLVTSNSWKLQNPESE